MLSPDMNGNDFDIVGPGTIQDVADHPYNNLPSPGASPPAQHSTKMAGAVITIPSLNGPGEDSRAVDHALGKESPNVVSIGTPTLRSWASRTNSRLNK